MADPVYYFVGGEDIDFPYGGSLPEFTASTSADRLRPAFSRGYITVGQNNPPKYSPQFSVGVTSAWLHVVASVDYSDEFRCIGLGSYANRPNSRSGIYICANYGGAGHAAILKCVNTTWTVLSSALSVYGGGLGVWDLQLVNYGVSANLFLYVNKCLAVSAIGVDASISGIASFDCLIAGHCTGNYRNGYISEIVCSDTETIHIKGVKTRIPISAGETNDMIGTYADVDDAAVDTNTNLITDTDGAEAQFVGTAMPTVEQVGSDYKIGHRKIVAYASRTFDASVDTIHLGEHVAGGVSDYDAGQLLVPGYTSYERHIPGSISKEDAAPKQLAVKLTTAV